MPNPPAHIPAAQEANIVKRDGVYRLFMRVQGRWLETGITSRRFLEITQIADREFAKVHVNAPMTEARDEGSDAASDTPSGST